MDDGGAVKAVYCRRDCGFVFFLLSCVVVLYLVPVVELGVGMQCQAIIYDPSVYSGG